MSKSTQMFVLGLAAGIIGPKVYSALIASRAK